MLLIFLNGYIVLILEITCIPFILCVTLKEKCWDSCWGIVDGKGVWPPWPPSPKYTPLLRQDNCIHRVLIKFGPSLMQLFPTSLYEKWLRFRDYGIIPEQGKASAYRWEEEKIKSWQNGNGGASLLIFNLNSDKTLVIWALWIGRRRRRKSYYNTLRDKTNLWARQKNKTKKQMRKEAKKYDRIDKQGAKQVSD